MLTCVKGGFIYGTARDTGRTIKENTASLKTPCKIFFTESRSLFMRRRFQKNGSTEEAPVISPFIILSFEDRDPEIRIITMKTSYAACTIIAIIRHVKYTIAGSEA